MMGPAVASSLTLIISLNGASATAAAGWVAEMSSGLLGGAPLDLRWLRILRIMRLLRLLLLTGSLPTMTANPTSVLR